MNIVDGAIALDEDDREFIAYMVSLEMIKDPSVSLRHLAQIWYERGYEDAIVY